MVAEFLVAESLEFKILTWLESRELLIDEYDVDKKMSNMMMTNMTTTKMNIMMTIMRKKKKKISVNLFFIKHQFQILP